ncbi:MAG TPA: sulfotransferase [Steroidobacteraceae bacterium]|jgi:tetratricopeptide (TPR) repeat protein|nr:sulfotransferase [Steroidobacteraceae bacterium]
MQRKDKVKSAGAPTAAPQAASASSLSAEERDQRLYQAVLAYRSARYAEADAAARELRAAVADFFPALLLGGMVAGKCGRGAEGIALLREAVALDPQSAEARSELASLLRSEGRHDAAIAAAKQALRLKPEDAGNHNDLGLCYLAAGRVPLAIKELTRALALKPDAPMFHHNLGLALQQQSRDFEAIAAFRRAVALDGDNTEAHAHLGQLLYQHGQPQEATQCYERAAALQPNRAVAAVQTAEALVQQGRTADAESCLRTTLAADPQADLVHQVLGVLLQRLGRFAEARASLERAIELQPRRISAYASLVRGQRIGAADAPLVAAMQRLVHEPTLPARDRSSLHFALGKACDDLGDYKAAIGHFDRANEIESEWMRAAGRWFDRRARAAFVDQMIASFPPGRGARAVGGSRSELPALIVGMPRSGTTLVEQILSNHRDIGAAGELSYWTDWPVAGTPIGAPPDDARGRELAESYLALLRKAAPDARRVTDKMPVNFLVLGLIHRLLPAARIIHCRRHPVDTCLSIYSTPVGNPLDFAHDRSHLVFYYEQYLRLMAHWRVVIPAGQLLEIDYERLVSEPEEVTRRLVAFCGLEWDAACLEHERSEHLIMTPSVWQARQPVYRDALERWRRYEPWLGAFRRLLPAT